jgi:hypothetical protein
MDAFFIFVNFVKIPNTGKYSNAFFALVFGN